MGLWLRQLWSFVDDFDIINIVFGQLKHLAGIMDAGAVQGPKSSSSNEAEARALLAALKKTEQRFGSAILKMDAKEVV